MHLSQKIMVRPTLPRLSPAAGACSGSVAELFGEGGEGETMKTKYKAVTWWAGIEKHEIERETEKCVFLVNSRKELKESSDTKWFDTWNEAYLWMVGRQHMAVKWAEDRLAREKQRLEVVAAMEEE
jgi:hypothetical protein